ncbi:hypothetical protein CY0110_12842 [Crocosphaera chwakensis CCY0110]|uniref:Uncharacterized protein n=1 Tax=Crocosphaera chwakensis CCY0110 TaxID=391612 RepID=A3IQU9_9CHRO|nr:hypothetical protein CY0110_12842 [Crocosphaera chwakensis CCY0110]
MIIMIISSISWKKNKKEEIQTLIKVNINKFLIENSHKLEDILVKERSKTKLIFIDNSLLLKS